MAVFQKQHLLKLLNMLPQTVPVFRVFLPEHLAVGPRHRDESYHEQPNEINFWLPLTDAFDSNSSTRGGFVGRRELPRGAEGGQMRRLLRIRVRREGCVPVNGVAGQCSQPRANRRTQTPEFSF